MATLEGTLSGRDIPRWGMWSTDSSYVDSVTSGGRRNPQTSHKFPTTILLMVTCLQTSIQEQHMWSSFLPPPLFPLIFSPFYLPPPSSSPPLLFLSSPPLPFPPSPDWLLLGACTVSGMGGSWLCRRSQGRLVSGQ